VRAAIGRVTATSRCVKLTEDVVIIKRTLISALYAVRRRAQCDCSGFSQRGID
jgi:hypothetical protein